MSFQVTARRWRPQTFDEVIGQEHVTSTLKSAIKGDRIAHAYLFAGTRGVGKTTTARILAKALNCEGGPTPDPCGKCPACLEVSEGGAMDVMEIDGASNRGIEEIRNLRENVRYAPARGRYKIYIIDEVHMLTIHAFNALLKTLEEPPPQVVFIMATTEVAKVPATIVSRCQRFDFRMIAQSLIREHLEEISRQDSLTLPPEVLTIVARSARGSMRDAQSLLDQLVSYCGGQVTTEEVMLVLGMVDYDVLSACMEALLKGDAAALLRQMEEIRASGRDFRLFCAQLLRYLRDLVVLKAGGDSALLPEVPPERRQTMVEQAGRVSLAKLELLFGMLSRADSEMARSSYQDLVLEMALVRMSQAESFMSLSEILTRLEELEAKIERGGAAGKRDEKELSLPLGGLLKSAPSTERREDARPAGQASEAAGEVEGKRPAELSKEELWQRILDQAKKMNHLEQYLAQGWLTEVTEDAVEIAFPQEHSFNAQLLRQLGKLADLQEAVCKALGKRVSVRFAGTEPKPEAEESREEEEEAPSRHWNPVEEPLVKQVLDIFGGRIVAGGRERAPF